MRIARFEWDRGNAGHIEERHGLSADEAEEVFGNVPLVRKLRGERLVAYGQTDDGRYLTVTFILKQYPGAPVLPAEEAKLSMAKELPRFQNEEEEAKFWDNHSPLDYAQDDEQVNIELAPELAAKIEERSKAKRVTLRLRVSQIEAAKEIARKKDIPYQTLIRSWIVEAIRQERERM